MKKPNLQSPAAQRKALKVIESGNAYTCPKLNCSTVINIIDMRGTKLIAEFDLRKCITKGKGK